MGLFSAFGWLPISSQNPRGGQQNSKDPWTKRDSSRNAPDETLKNGHHTKLCVNNVYLAKETGFWIDFDIRVDTHAKIRKWVSKVTCFTTFPIFLKQNAQDVVKSKMKRMADLPRFGIHLDSFTTQRYREKSLKTRVCGTSQPECMARFYNSNATRSNSIAFYSSQLILIN